MVGPDQCHGWDLTVPFHALRPRLLTGQLCRNPFHFNMPEVWRSRTTQIIAVYKQSTRVCFHESDSLSVRLHCSTMLERVSVESIPLLLLGAYILGHWFGEARKVSQRNNGIATTLKASTNRCINSLNTSRPLDTQTLSSRTGHGYNFNSMHRSFYAKATQRYILLRSL